MHALAAGVALPPAIPGLCAAALLPPGPGCVVCCHSTGGLLVVPDPHVGIFYLFWDEKCMQRLWLFRFRRGAPGVLAAAAAGEAASLGRVP